MQRSQRPRLYSGVGKGTEMLGIQPLEGSQACLRLYQCLQRSYVKPRVGATSHETISSSCKIVVSGREVVAQGRRRQCKCRFLWCNLAVDRCESSYG